MLLDVFAIRKTNLMRVVGKCRIQVGGVLKTAGLSGLVSTRQILRFPTHDSFVILLGLLYEFQA